MIENAGPIIIALWVVAIILGITTNFLKIRDHLINWYKKKAKRIVPSKMVNKESSINILNFSHPITHTQKEKIENILQKPIKEIIELPTQLDESFSFQPQLCDIINQAKISSESLQQGEYIVNLPGFAPAAAVLISELHGRMGHFPTVIRLKKVEGSTPPVYDVEEIMDLQAVRDEARTCR
ncbi:MAG: hypothetical protein K8R17_03160 [Methanosarcinales archaeon]|nr:hypothetical protein [Methanosarcinales archaeon]